MDFRSREVIGMGKSVALVCPSPTPTAMYPKIDSVGFVKVGFKSVVSSLTDPIFWKLFIGISSMVFVTGLIGSLFVKSARV